MTRIVAGAAAGRRLAVPPGTVTRPTADRVREALFSTLEADRGGLAGARVLDLYAGSGAVGLEALSRGAVAAVLVERDRAVLRVLRANVAAVGLAGAEVVGVAVERLPGSPPGPPVDVCFADPPYAERHLGAVLDRLAAGGWFAAGATVVVERPTRAGEFGWPAALRPTKRRRYGEATLWYACFGTVSAAAHLEGVAGCPAERSAPGPSTR